MTEHATAPSDPPAAPSGAATQDSLQSGRDSAATLGVLPPSATATETAARAPAPPEEACRGCGASVSADQLACLECGRLGARPAAASSATPRMAPAAGALVLAGF